MTKKCFIILAGVILGIVKGYAQESGMLPITGMQYFKEGIWAKSINAKMNGQYLMGNRIFFNTEIEINLQQISGLTPDKKKNVFPAARYCLLNGKGDTIQPMSNFMLEHQGVGFTPKEMTKGLIIKVIVKEGLVQPNSKAIICIVLFDQLKNNLLRLEYPISLAYPREKIPLSQAASLPLKSPPGSISMAFGLTSKTIEFKVDTAISYNTKLAYVQLTFSKLGGTDLISMLQGKEMSWVYDTLFNEIKAKDKILKDVGGALEGGSGTVNCTVKIPFRSKTDKRNGYFVRYRWDSPDKTQALEIVAKVQ